MIISHKYKYIFIKSKKVAGTSVEAALAKHCGGEDIVTPIEYSPELDEDEYSPLFKNYEGYYNHITPDEIIKKIGQKTWDEYYKFTIVRNPWDLVVSRYWWEKRNPPKKKFTIKKIMSNVFNRKAYSIAAQKLRHKKRNKTFEQFVNSLTVKNTPTNGVYYFDKDNKPLCDYYMRYENLDEEYKKVCAHLGIPRETLPKLKTKTRKNKEHYSTYYTEQTKQKVSEIFKKEIEFFNYEFEQE
jgi:hypothetical protein